MVPRCWKTVGTRIFRPCRKSYTDTSVQCISNCFSLYFYNTEYYNILSLYCVHSCKYSIYSLVSRPCTLNTAPCLTNEWHQCREFIYSIYYRYNTSICNTVARYVFRVWSNSYFICFYCILFLPTYLKCSYLDLFCKGAWRKKESLAGCFMPFYATVILGSLLQSHGAVLFLSYTGN